MPAWTRQTGWPGRSREGWLLDCLWQKNPSLRPSRRVLSTPKLHTRWTSCLPVLTSLLPYLLPVQSTGYWHQRKHDATQRNATRRSAARPNHPIAASDPNRTRPNPIRSSQGSCRATRSASGLFSVHIVPAGWSLLEIQRSNSDRRRTGPAPDPASSLQTPASSLQPPDSGRQTTTQSVPTYLACSLARPPDPGQTDDFCARDHPGLVSSGSSEPARPHPLASTIHTRTRSITPSCPALPCPVLHRISARYTPRRAAPPACPPQ